MKFIQSYVLKSNVLFGSQRNLICLLKKFQSTITTNEVSSTAEFEDEEEIKAKKYEQRNKSRLLPQDRKRLFDNLPYEEPQSWVHLTEKYQRKMFGKYGVDSKVNPRICFYTKTEKELRKEYDSVAYPYTIQEMMEINKNQKEEKRLKIQKREDDIAKKLAKLEQWKIDLNDKIASKEAEALAAKQKKERLVEEVRRHFGFKVNPKDDRFKELLEQKEKEDRKKQKEAKRKARAEKMMEKLAGANAEIKSKEPSKKDSGSSIENNVQSDAKEPYKCIKYVVKL